MLTQTLKVFAKMNNALGAPFVVLLCVFVSAFAQQPSPTSTPTPNESSKEDILRVTTNLVQVDAVVLDKHGKQVTDLQPEDFIISEDGRPQKITYFTYISTGAVPPAYARTAKRTTDKTLPREAPTNVRPEEARRRILALVVDDLGMSFESMYYARRALKEFVDEQIQPTDLVAILRTSGGSGLWQQFTTDKQQLQAAINRLQFNARARPGIRSLSVDEDADWSKRRADIDRAETFSVGTISALGFVVNGLSALPGRKSIVLLSDNLPQFFGREKSERIMNPLQRLVEQANRAAVNIYTMSALGLATLNATAADGFLGSSANPSAVRLPMVIPRRAREFLESESGLQYLATETGGFFSHNNNDLNLGLQRVLDEQEGYYLIGYRPSDSSIDAATGRRGSHIVTVRVNRRDLKARMRTGSYAAVIERARAVPRTHEEQLFAALTSPFTVSEIIVRLTSLFKHSPSSGSSIHSLIHVDRNSLKFTQVNDSYQAKVDLLLIVVAENGQVIDKRNHTETISIAASDYPAGLQNPAVFSLKVPVAKAGAYQLRMAVRDATSAQVGSYTQFIEVPALDNRRLALSGIDLRSQGIRQLPTPLRTESPKQGDEIELELSPAVRRFRSGMMLDYACEIYNAQLNMSTRQPELATQVRLFHEGREVFASDLSPLNRASAQSNMSQPALRGHLRLGAHMPTGQYMLQVIVIDKLAKGKEQVAVQWIDFEIQDRPY